MTWTELKKNIYHEDGSLRDIYVNGITPADWKLWIDFVNANYRIDFEVGDSLSADTINVDAVLYSWRGRDRECCSGTIYLGNIIIKTYFFSEEELENDINPNEIKGIADHQTLIDYLTGVSNLLGKPVKLTEENPKEQRETLMIVERGRVTFPAW